MKREPAICGTYAGYQQHRKRGEDACGPCTKANTEYKADFRARRPDILKREKRTNAARSRALWRLADRHRDEFDALVLEELARERVARITSV